MSYNDDRKNPNSSNYPNDGSTAANSRAPQWNQKDPNLPQESTGAVASDSLAAESMQSGGGFADNNTQAMGVSGSSSTLNNTDTSGATTLQPAADSTDREFSDRLATDDSIKGPGGLKYAEGVGGQGNFSGQHNLDGYSGGPSADRSSQTQSSGTYSTGQSGPTSGEEYRASSAIDQAPTYVGDFRTEGQLKPKGANLTEGDIPQTKTFTGDVGGPHDPGRVAEQSFQNANSDTAGSGGARQYGAAGGSTGAYDVLSSERAGDQSSKDDSF